MVGAKPLSEPMMEYCLTGTLGTNLSEILSEINTFSFTKMHLKMTSAKWRPFCPALNVLSKLHSCCIFTFWANWVNNVLRPFQLRSIYMITQRQRCHGIVSTSDNSSSGQTCKIIHTQLYLKLIGFFSYLSVARQQKMYVYPNVTINWPMIHATPPDV